MRFLISILLTTISISANALTYDCRWTAEGTDANWSDVVMDAPIVFDGSCKKVCYGYVYCKSQQLSAPIVTAVSCSALQDGSCPTANNCFDDQSVLMNKPLPSFSELSSYDSKFQEPIQQNGGTRGIR